MIKKIDELGRIVIPKEYRELLNIQAGSCLTVTLQNGKIVIQIADGTAKCDICGHLYSIADKYCSQCGKKL